MQTVTKKTPGTGRNSYLGFVVIPLAPIPKSGIICSVHWEATQGEAGAGLWEGGVNISGKPKGHGSYVSSLEGPTALFPCRILCPPLIHTALPS